MIPNHVPAKLVHDFDFYTIPGQLTDVHAELVALRQTAPEIFWTPRNGGHWVVTGGEDILTILRDPVHFSNRVAALPPAPDDYPRVIPLELDPPRHGHYRRPLVASLHPSFIAEVETDVRQVAIETIERLLPAGGCEFIEDFAKILPIHVFLRLVDLPLQDKSDLMRWAEEGVHGGDVAVRNAAQAAMAGYLGQYVRARRAAPGGDLLSKIVSINIEGEPISEAEAINFSMLLLFGGLDTVAAMLGFIARFLADHPEERRELVDNLEDEGFLRAAVDELLRRHGIANIARVLAEDFTYKSINFRAGDHLLPINSCVGLDEQLNPEPLAVDFHRARPQMAVFGAGTHACPGAVLARREIRVFLEEWLVRIPDFRIRPGTLPVFVTGLTNAVLRLDLVWP